MTQMKRRVIGLILTLALLVSAFSVLTVAAAASTDGIIEAAGWLESAYVEWAPISGAEGYNVYVQKKGASGWDQIDSMLIREYPDYWRADAVGLAAGTYNMKVIALFNGAESDHSLIAEDLVVLPHDRAGYAHTKGSVGAYNNDGTLKAGAVVVYVTNENKDTVTANIGGTTYTGFQSIVFDSKKSTATICVRIIGEIDIPSTTTKGQIEIKENKTAITIEGIGEDATCNGWGIALKNQSTNIEVRNLAFMNNASGEGDNVSLEGSTYCWVHNCDFFYGTDRGGDKNKGDGALDTKKSQYITHSYNHFWDCGKCNLQGSSGSDTSDYITYHHNWYDHSDSRHPRVRVAHVHVYNNYYDGNAKYGIGSTTQSDVFAESNYFNDCNNPMMISKQGTDALGEGTFSDEVGGSIKAYGNIIVSAKSFMPGTNGGGTNFDAIVVENKSDKVTQANAGGYVYDNFDTNGGLNYTYTADAAADVPTIVSKYAGRVNGGDFEWTFTAADADLYDRNTDLDSKLQKYTTDLKSVGGKSVITGSTGGNTNIGGAVGDNSGNDTGSGDSGSGSGTGGGSSVVFPAGSYIHNFHESGKDSSFFSIIGNLSTSKGTITFNGMSLTQCLKMETETSIIFTASENGRLVLVFGSGAAGKGVKIDGTKYSIGSDNILETTVSVGAHTITKGDSVNLYYMVYTSDSVGEVHKHAYVESVTTEPTCTATGVKTFTCSCNDSYTESIAAKGHNHTLTSTVEATCTATGEKTFTCGACGDSYTESISAKGHSYSPEVTKEATCTATGVKTFTCGNCGDSYIETIDAKGHSFVSGACSICGAPESDEHEHSYTGSVAKPATCTEIGVMKYVCSCGDEYLEQIAAKGHTYVLSSTKEATCTENGQRAYACSCGSKYTEQINAKGHEYEESVTKEATCTEAGTKTFSCSCGNSYTEEIAAKGHSFAEGVCSSCGEEEKKEDVTPEAPGDGNNGGEENGTEDEEPEEKLNFFQRIFRAIANFFRRLFGLKTK